MSRPVIRPVTALFAGLIAACSATATGTTGGNADAALSVLNALQPTDAPTATLDGETILLPASGQSTGFPITSGEHRFEARSAGGQVLATLNFAAVSGSHRTVVVAGALSEGVSIVSTIDTASIPPANAAKIRVVHTVADAPPLNALLFPTGGAVDSAATFVTPFSFGTGTDPNFPGYAVRPLGSYTVRVVTPGTTAAVAETQVTLGDGQLWSVVLVRNASGALELRPVREGGASLH